MASKNNPSNRQGDTSVGQVWVKDDGTELPMVAMRVVRQKQPTGMYWVAVDGANVYMRPIR